jgi:hypothetical protein
MPPHMKSPYFVQNMKKIINPTLITNMDRFNFEFSQEQNGPGRIEDVCLLNTASAGIAVISLRSGNFM